MEWLISPACTMEKVFQASMMGELKNKVHASFDPDSDQFGDVGMMKVDENSHFAQEVVSSFVFCAAADPFDCYKPAILQPSSVNVSISALTYLVLCSRKQP